MPCQRAVLWLDLRQQDKQVVMPLIRCKHCDGDFEPKTRRGRFCSAKCCKAAWQRKREERETRTRELAKAMAKEAGLRPEGFA